MIRRPPRPPLFPYTPLSQSRADARGAEAYSACLGRRAATHDREAPAGVRPQDTARRGRERSEEHTSELQSRQYLVCRLLLEKKKKKNHNKYQKDTRYNIYI